ncbi:hypothetical protein TNCV_287191 [Trichonephila clavipes]|nr:hypothetical protein TNCV_287191 [Trichonephila clavipes]
MPSRGLESRPCGSAVDVTINYTVRELRSSLSWPFESVTHCSATLRLMGRCQIPKLRRETGANDHFGTERMAMKFNC